MKLSLNLVLRVVGMVALLAVAWGLTGPLALAQNAPVAQPLPPPTQVPPPQPPPAQGMPVAPPQPGPANQYSPNELIDAGHRFFGGVSRGLAMVVEKAVSQWGQPNGYVLGECSGRARVSASTPAPTAPAP